MYLSFFFSIRVKFRLNEGWELIHKIYHYEAIYESYEIEPSRVFGVKIFF